MQKIKANKWQTSLNQIKKAKLKWRQFSVHKGSVLDHMKSMSFPELQEMYNNLPDYFWRDNGEFFINYIFKVMFEVQSVAFLLASCHAIFFDKTNVSKLCTQFNLTDSLLLHGYLNWRQMELNYSFVKSSRHHLPFGELILVIARIYGQLGLILWEWQHHQKPLN